MSNVVVDSDHPPSEVRLELLPPVRGVFRDVFGRYEGFMLRVFDEHEIEFATCVFEGTEPYSFELPPGAYRFELHDGSERVLIEAFELSSDPLEIEL